jgi:hypothetical protein
MQHRTDIPRDAVLSHCKKRKVKSPEDCASPPSGERAYAFFFVCSPHSIPSGEMHNNLPKKKAASSPAFLFCNEITLPEGEGYLCKEK